MNKRASWIAAALMALAGSGVAVLLPTASSARTTAHDVTTSCTSTPTAPPYIEYCEVSAPPSTDFTAGPSEPVGTVLEPGVTVTGNTGGNLTVNDNGQVVTIPSGATVTVYEDGTIFVGTTSATFGKLTVRVIDSKATEVYLQTATGISFGYNHTKAQILGAVKFYNGAAVDRPSGAALLSTPHGKLLVALGTPTQDLTIGINSHILEYTKEEIQLIKAHHAKKASILVKVGTANDMVYQYKMYVPITTLTEIAPTTSSHNTVTIG